MAFTHSQSCPEHHDTKLSLVHAYPIDSIRKESKLHTGEVPSLQKNEEYCGFLRKVVISRLWHADVWE